jgi:hypothetical protein
MKSEAFFATKGEYVIPLDFYSNSTAVEVEKLYQVFKERLLLEIADEYDSMLENLLNKGSD